MYKHTIVLPSIAAAISEREIRNNKRVLVAVKADLGATKRQHKIDLLQEKELAVFNRKSDFEAARLEMERNDEVFRESQLQSAMALLDRLNPGCAHTHFHGISDAATSFNVPINTLRRRYEARRSKAYELSVAPQVEASTVDDALLGLLVDRCVLGGEKPHNIWAQNAEALKDRHCGKTTFADIVSRRKLDPNSPLRVKMGRGDRIDNELIQQLAASSKQSDMSG
jgi:hypothetical protein